MPLFVTSRKSRNAGCSNTRAILFNACKYALRPFNRSFTIISNEFNSDPIDPFSGSNSFRGAISSGISFDNYTSF